MSDGFYFFVTSQVERLQENAPGINSFLIVLLTGLVVSIYNCLLLFGTLRKSMGVRSSKSQSVGATESTTGKQVLNDALAGHSVGGPSTLAYRLNKKLMADKRKFLDPSVLETMKNIDQEDVLKFERFNRWLLENGTTFPNLEYQQYADAIRGVHTTQSISAMVQIMAISRKCLITDAMGRATEQGKRLQAVEPELSVPNHCQVIVYMMNGIDNGNTFFQPYYDVLPKNFNNFPIFWDSKKLGWLKGSSLVEEIEERKRNMRNDYNTICRALPEFKRFTFKEFLWCRTAVGSRNFSIVIGEDKVTAMVPFADMLNHFRPRETSWRYDNAQEAFTMTSLCPLQNGHQVMDSYGKKCNSKFLLHYGFTIEDNREADGKCQNEVQIQLKLSPNPDPLQNMRLKFVHRTLLTRISMNAEDAGTVDAMLFARVAVATESELMYWIDNCDADQSPELPINARNEIEALNMVARAASAKLAHYKSTEQEDAQIIRSEQPFSDRRHAAIVIRSEKQVLRFFVELAERVGRLLQMSPRSRNREIRVLGTGTDINRFLVVINNDLLDMGK